MTQQDLFAMFASRLRAKAHALNDYSRNLVHAGGGEITEESEKDEFRALVLEDVANIAELLIEWAGNQTEKPAPAPSELDAAKKLLGVWMSGDSPCRSVSDGNCALINRHDCIVVKTREFLGEK